MSEFLYQAVDPGGNQKQGTISARDRGDALNRLSSQGLQTLSLRQGTEPPTREKSKNVSPVENSKPKPSLSALTKIRLSGSQLITFTEEMSDLLQSGFQLEPSLKLMEGRQDIPVIAKVAGLVRSEIRDGTPFARALAKASPSFDPLYVNLVSAGEASGTLSSLLHRHTQYLIKLQELRNKIVTAMIYPAFLLLAGAAVTVLFVTFLIPRLTLLIESTGSGLPKGVQLLIVGSEFLKGYWWAVLLVILISVLTIRKILSLPSVRPGWDRSKLSIPIAGKLIRARFQVHFLRTLGNLLSNGLSLVDALRLTNGITSNRFLRNQMSEIIEEVVDGSSLHQCLRKRRCFHPSLADYVRISEQTGNLDQGIEKAAERSEKALEKDIERGTAMIQPAIIVIMAGVIGMMAYLMIGVIYDTIEILRSG